MENRIEKGLGIRQCIDVSQNSIRDMAEKIGRIQEMIDTEEKRIAVKRSEFKKEEFSVDEQTEIYKVHSAICKAKNLKENKKTTNHV